MNKLEINISSFKKRNLCHLPWFRYLVLLFFLVLIFSKCDNFITDYGPQPNNIEKLDHEPLLNIFGILRPGQSHGKPLSFVHLEGSFSVTSEYPDSFEVVDARVTLFAHHNNSISDSIVLNYTNFNSIFPTIEYRPENLSLVEKQSYSIRCQKDGFPTLTAETTMPAIPVIVDNSIEINSNLLKFEIEKDTLVGLYDVYFFSGQKTFSTRVQRSGGKNTQIEVLLESNFENFGWIVVYAYDSNLSDYMMYHITIKPNTYQPTYSTVTNGYGCFGSMNILEFKIEF